MKRREISTSTVVLVNRGPKVGYFRKKTLALKGLIVRPMTDPRHEIHTCKSIYHHFGLEMPTKSLERDFVDDFGRHDQNSFYLSRWGKLENGNFEIRSWHTLHWHTRIDLGENQFRNQISIMDALGLYHASCNGHYPQKQSLLCQLPRLGVVCLDVVWGAWFI